MAEAGGLSSILTYKLLFHGESMFAHEVRPSSSALATRTFRLALLSIKV